MSFNKGIIFFMITVCYGCGLSKKIVMDKERKVVFQGHRGCRGLLPENTIPAFIKALEYVDILECDVVVSKDKKIIVSHDPWVEASICSHPDGRPVTEKEEKEIRIINLTYEEIKAFDCGIRGNKKYPDQKAMSAYKPSLMEMVTTIDNHCKENNRPLPYYDIEIKSLEKWYDDFTPRPVEYVTLVLNELAALGIEDRCNLQSFDINILEEINKQNSKIVQAYLIDNISGFEKNMAKLSFVPQIYSPYYKLVTKKLANKVHDKGMRIIPWTVNEIEDMQKMIDAGVDGIITDYPNRVASFQK